MKKAFFVTILILPLALLLPVSGGAVTETSTTPSATIENKTQEIENIKESVKKQVEEKIQQIMENKNKLGWVGIIKGKSATSLILETRNGEREVLLGEETKIVNDQSLPKSVDDLIEGKKIAALGYQEGESILEGKRIIIMGDSLSEKVGLLGIISDKSTVENLIVITPTGNKDGAVEIKINSGTTIENGEGKVTYSDLNKGDKVALVYQNEKEEKLALLIKVLSSVEKEAEATLSPQS